MRPKISMGCVLIEDIRSSHLGMEIYVRHLCTLISIMDIFIL